MSFTDTTAIKNKNYRYSVTAFNTVGLKSKKLNLKTRNKSKK